VQIETDRHRPGDIIPVRIVRVGSNSLFGEPADRQAPMTAAA
jgi:hypothetical protein